MSGLSTFSITGKEKSRILLPESFLSVLSSEVSEAAFGVCAACASKDS